MERERESRLHPRQLGPANEIQIRAPLRVSPAQRIKTMMATQEMVLNTWGNRLRQAHPDLSDLQLCRMVFERLKQNG
ncbi:MAG: hypothetical protein HY318_02840 [Armatimonadetes bacterium]|nr:hypothetical protein [Armatimonadota bacterium]